jgi:hypothetical protein
MAFPEVNMRRDTLKRNARQQMGEADARSTCQQRFGRLLAITSTFSPAVQAGGLPKGRYPAIPLRKVLDENQTRHVAEASGVFVRANLMALRPAKTRNLVLARRSWNKAKRTSTKRSCKNR